MSPSEHIYNSLKGLFDGRIYPSVAPQGEVLPYVVYSIVYDADEQPYNTSPISRRTRVQVDVWAHTYEEAEQAAEAVRSALYAADYYPHGYSVTNEYVDDLNIHRRTLDFTIRGDR